MVLVYHICGQSDMNFNGVCLTDSSRPVSQRPPPPTRSGMKRAGGFKSSESIPIVLCLSRHSTAEQLLATTDIHPSKAGHLAPTTCICRQVLCTKFTFGGSRTILASLKWHPASQPKDSSRSALLSLYLEKMRHSFVAYLGRDLVYFKPSFLWLGIFEFCICQTVLT
jgi:hypothetical protein